MPSKACNWLVLTPGEPVNVCERRWVLFRFDMPTCICVGFFREVFNVENQQSETTWTAPGITRNSAPTHFCDCLPDEFDYPGMT